MTQYKIIIAGFGGQKILSAGRLLAYAGMLENKNVSWLPSYGVEKIGGTSNCHVIISNDEVESPILNDCDVLIVMNEPSLNKFEKYVNKDGIIIQDSSLVSRSIKRDYVKQYKIPASFKAADMGDLTFAVILLLGKLIKITGIIKKESIEKALYGILKEKYHHLIPQEMKALQMGMES